MKNLHLFRTWYLPWLAAIALLVVTAGCGGGGIKIGGSDSGDVDDGAGESGIEIASVGAAGGSGFGARGIAIAFDSPVEASAAVAGAAKMTQAEVEAAISVVDASGGAVSTTKVWSADRTALTLRGPFRYGATYTVTLSGSSSSSVTMPPNPFNFDGDAAETADYPLFYSDSAGGVDRQFILPGNVIAAAAGGTLDAVDSLGSLWTFDINDDLFLPRIYGRLLDIDGSGAAGFVSPGYSIDEADTSGISFWRSYDVADTAPWATLEESEHPPQDAVVLSDGTRSLSRAWSMGDVDGDGISETAIEESYNASKRTSYSVLSIVRGPFESAVSSVPVANFAAVTADVGLLADLWWQDHISLAKAPADVDGDGKGDIVAAWSDTVFEDLGGGLGTSYYGGATSLNASALLIYLGSAGLNSMLDAPAVRIDMTASPNEWFSSADVADVNGDGLSDIIARSSLTTFLPDLTEITGSTIYVFLGRPSWESGLTQLDADAIINSGTLLDMIMDLENSDRPTNMTVASGGDINADGCAELLVAVSTGDTRDLYILMGRRSWEKAYNVTEDYGIRALDGAGFSIGFAYFAPGDIDNDGYDDLAIRVNPDAGESYYLLYRGSSSPPANPTPADAFVQIMDQRAAP